MTLEILLSLTVLGLVIALFFILNKQKSSVSPDSQLLSLVNDLRKEIQSTTSDQHKEVQGQLDLMHKRMLDNMKDSSTTLQKHFRHTSEIITNVTERLTKLDETNKQVLNFSEQLQGLQNILKNPKQRGILGEYWLESLLGQVLPPGHYEMQHQLGKDEKTGQKLIPDAVIFVKEITVPIDAKFSLENYNRIVQEPDKQRRADLEKLFKSDVKQRIDETSKYIRPEHGTTNFAFMFVPAEGVYHNLISQSVGAVEVNSQNLIEYAFKKGVMIVSPTALFAYLQTVVMGLNALKIEDSVKEIQKHTEKLMRHMRAYEDHHNRVGKHLDTTIRAYTASSKELKKIDKDIFKITAGEVGKELAPLELEVRDRD